LSGSTNGQAGRIGAVLGRRPRSTCAIMRAPFAETEWQPLQLEEMNTSAFPPDGIRKTFPPEAPGNLDESEL
jgi:hypothetical protein